MARRSDIEFWKKCARLYCESASKTLKVAKELIDDFHLPPNYVEAIAVREPEPGLVVHALASMQKLVCDVVRGDLFETIRIENRVHMENLSEGRPYTLNKFIDNFPRSMSKTQLLQRAEVMGRQDAIYHLTTVVNEHADDVVSCLYQDEARSVAEVIPHVVAIRYAIQRINKHSVYEIVDTLTEVLRAYRDTADVNLVRRGYQAWGSSVLPEHLISFDAKDVREYLTPSP